MQKGVILNLDKDCTPIEMEISDGSTVLSMDKFNQYSLAVNPSACHLIYFEGLYVAR